MRLATRLLLTHVTPAALLLLALAATIAGLAWITRSMAEVRDRHFSTLDAEEELHRAAWDVEVAARHDVRLALSDTLRVAAEGIDARLRTGSLAGPVESQIRGRSGSLTVWLWRGEHPTMDQRPHPDAAE